MQPWALAKDPSLRARLGTVLYHALEASRVAALLMAPFTPTAAQKLWEALVPGGGPREEARVARAGALERPPARGDLRDRRAAPARHGTSLRRRPWAPRGAVPLRQGGGRRRNGARFLPRPRAPGHPARRLPRAGPAGR